MSLLGGFDPAGEIRAGASAYDAAGVTGVGNIFGSWPQAVQALAALAQPQPIVGYERGRDLIAAEKAGFEPLGALRVWTRAEPA